VYFNSISSERAANVVEGLMSTLEDKRLEVSITTVAEAHAIAQFKADKPKPNKPDTTNDKQDKPGNNKTKFKEHTGGQPMPPSEKAHKKTEVDKEE
jgi:hypothetical protein